MAAKIRGESVRSRPDLSRLQLQSTGPWQAGIESLSGQPSGRAPDLLLMISSTQSQIAEHLGVHLSTESRVVRRGRT